MRAVGTTLGEVAPKSPQVPSEEHSLVPRASQAPRWQLGDFRTGLSQLMAPSLLLKKFQWPLISFSELISHPLSQPFLPGSSDIGFIAIPGTTKYVPSSGPQNMTFSLLGLLFPEIPSWLILSLHSSSCSNTTSTDSIFLSVYSLVLFSSQHSPPDIMLYSCSLGKQEFCLLCSLLCP